MPILTTTSRARAAPPRRRASPHLEGLPGGEPLPPPRTPEHFRRFCRRNIKLDNGKMLEPEPFQVRGDLDDGDLPGILDDFFDGVRETLALIPSGNGKTTLYAALALYCLLYWDDPEIFIMAASRDQAGRMHKHVCGFVARSPALEKRVQTLRRGANLKGRTGSIEILASDADTVDGINPYPLAIIDELHRHKDTGLYDVALKGLKKRGGQLLHCSTAGETENSPLGELRKRGHKIPGLRRVGMHTYGRTKTNTFALHEWSLEESDDPHDMAVVKQANPLGSITERDLAAEHEAMKWWAWARFACGLWVAGEHAALSPLDWADCGAPNLELAREHEHLLSIDLAWVRDSTAIDALQAVSRTDVRQVAVATIEPPGDGTAIRQEQILGPIRAWKTANPMCGRVVIDPEAGGRQLVEALEDLGFEVVEHSQKNEPMADAAARLDEVIRNRHFRHRPDAQVTAQVLAAAAKQLEGGRWKFVKRRKNPEWIDHCIAIAMGVRVLLAELDEPEVDRSAYRMEFIGS